MLVQSVGSVNYISSPQQLKKSNINKAKEVSFGAKKFDERIFGIPVYRNIFSDKFLKEFIDEALEKLPSPEAVNNYIEAKVKAAIYKEGWSYAVALRRDYNYINLEFGANGLDSAREITHWIDDGRHSSVKSFRQSRIYRGVSSTL